MQYIRYKSQNYFPDSCKINTTNALGAKVAMIVNFGQIFFRLRNGYEPDLCLHQLRLFSSDFFHFANFANFETHQPPSAVTR